MRGVGFHPGLKNQDGGHAVNGLSPFFDGKIGLAQEAVGLSGGPALVPEVDSDAEVGVKVVGETAHLLGLGSFGTAQPQRQADDDFPDIVLCQQFA